MLYPIEEVPSANLLSSIARFLLPLSSMDNDRPVAPIVSSMEVVPSDPPPPAPPDLPHTPVPPDLPHTPHLIPTPTSTPSVQPPLPVDPISIQDTVNGGGDTPRCLPQATAQILTPGSRTQGSTMALPSWICQGSGFAASRQS